MTVHHKVDDEWTTQAVISNYSATPPEGAPRAQPPAESPPDLTDSPMAELAAFYTRHFNMGHGDVVASRYAEDAVVTFADSPVVTGRAAVAEQLNQRIAAGETPQITIHEVEAMDIGDGWVLGGGWYELSSAAVGNSQGSWMNLARAGDDGAMQIHWAVTNGHPVM
jgi:ketosteroid isomerase-like protein